MTVRELWTAIRRTCLDCSDHQPKEIRLCPITTCALWPYRMGKDQPVQVVKPTRKGQKSVA
jgi:hypothetical protein